MSEQITQPSFFSNQTHCLASGREVQESVDGAPPAPLANSDIVAASVPSMPHGLERQTRAHRLFAPVVQAPTAETRRGVVLDRFVSPPPYEAQGTSIGTSLPTGDKLLSPTIDGAGASIDLESAPAAASALADSIDEVVASNSANMLGMHPGFARPVAHAVVGTLIPTAINFAGFGMGRLADLALGLDCARKPTYLLYGLAGGAAGGLIGFFQRPRFDRVEAHIVNAEFASGAWAVGAQAIVNSVALLTEAGGSNKDLCIPSAMFSNSIFVLASGAVVGYLGYSATEFFATPNASVEGEVPRTQGEYTHVAATDDAAESMA